MEIWARQFGKSVEKLGIVALMPGMSLDVWNCKLPSCRCAFAPGHMENTLGRSESPIGESPGRQNSLSRPLPAGLSVRVQSVRGLQWYLL